jgi:hypothetical protein
MNRYFFTLIVLTLIACKPKENLYLPLPFENNDVVISKIKPIAPSSPNYTNEIRDSSIPKHPIKIKTTASKAKRKIQVSVTDSLPKEKRKTDKFAIASGISFYSGMLLAGISEILGLSFIMLGTISGLLAVAGVVLAILAIRNKKKFAGKYKGYGWAISVLIVFGLLLLSGLMSALALSSLLA